LRDGRRKTPAATVRRGTVRRGTVRRGTVRRGTVRRGTVRRGTWLHLVPRLPVLRPAIVVAQNFFASSIDGVLRVELGTVLDRLSWQISMY